MSEKILEHMIVVDMPAVIKEVMEDEKRTVEERARIIADANTALSFLLVLQSRFEE